MLGEKLAAKSAKNDIQTYLKFKDHALRAGKIVQWLETLPNTCQALGSVSSTRGDRDFHGSFWNTLLKQKNKTEAEEMAQALRAPVLLFRYSSSAFNCQ